MKKSDLVKLNKTYERQNVEQGMHEIVLDVKENSADVLFFNEKIVPDYVVANIQLSDLMIEKEKLPIEFQNEIFKNLDKLISHAKQTIEKPKINEYDLVELVVENEKCLKYGIRKGDRGCVMDNNAVHNHILVDFSGIDKNGKFHGDCISVKIDHLKVIK